MIAFCPGRERFFFRISAILYHLSPSSTVVLVPGDYETVNHFPDFYEKK
jgi:hypothetical protein